MAEKKRQSTIQPITFNTEPQTVDDVPEERAVPARQPEKKRPSTIQLPSLNGFGADADANRLPQKPLSGTYLDTYETPVKIGGMTKEPTPLEDDPANTLIRPLARKTVKQKRISQGGVPTVSLPQAGSPVKPPEQRKREPVVSFRGIPQELKDKIQDIADELNCPVGIAARWLITVGIQAYQQGRLKLSPQISWAGLTLYPENGKKLGRPANRKKTESPLQRRAKKKNPGNVVSFRGITKEMHQNLVAIARDNAEVPVGDVARFFFEYGISLYARQEIRLTPEEILLWSKAES